MQDLSLGGLLRIIFCTNPIPCLRYIILKAAFKVQVTTEECFLELDDSSKAEGLDFLSHYFCVVGKDREALSMAVKAMVCHFLPSSSWG